LVGSIEASALCKGSDLREPIGEVSPLIFYLKGAKNPTFFSSSSLFFFPLPWLPPVLFPSLCYSYFMPFCSIYLLLLLSISLLPCFFFLFAVRFPFTLVTSSSFSVPLLVLFYALLCSIYLLFIFSFFFFPFLFYLVPPPSPSLAFSPLSRFLLS
jgi:hypothetical protein